jgi:hypothetical protein
MIDFTNCEVNRFKAYGGANGNKINVLYNDKSYMLKFPPKPRRNKDMRYTNSCISEYVSCHIFELLGFDTQETMLGTYTDRNGKEKLVVACADFTDGGKRLIEFAQLKNTCINSEQNGYGTDLQSNLDAMAEQTLIDPVVLRSFFWDMFIADALLGNFDRHNANWGLLVDEASQTVRIAPVYDCGSCLYPQLDIAGMEKVMNSESEIEQRIYVFPNSAIEQEGKKLSYFDFISSLQNAECIEALKRISSRIDMTGIRAIIDGTPTLIPIQKEFFKFMLNERHARILQYGLARLRQKERTENRSAER